MPASVKSKCTTDMASWPADRTEQGKAIQGMLRDLGLYDGTVYGTVGPTTRAAIRKFQLSAGQPETGEPDEALFASLKKKCAASTP
jgi:peptidoglycan hydrolase-like protein with peptidoglycan-binding domain